nr:MAG TPA: hypothetical protein [Caudoviricetes sp.]
MKIKYNNKEYEAEYNSQTGYYEINLNAPTVGGIYNVETEYTDLFEEKYTEKKAIQVLAKEKIKNNNETTFMWVFDGYDFKIKGIVELSNYEISIDEETNINTIVNVLKNIQAEADDIVAIKKENEVIYWGSIQEVSNEDGKTLYKYTLKYITNMFNQKVILKDEELIKTTGIEDFIAKTIKENFINNTDTFINKTFLKVIVKTHTKIQTTVDNVQDNIYNLHTWMTNCTQRYNIVYNFSIVDKMLVITIENKEQKKQLIDTTAQAISNYSEVFETNVVSKVTVLTKEEGEYSLYLLNDRTTTTDMKNKNRAKGKVETVYTEKMEDAPQKALDTMKSNSYNHNITFKMLNKYMKVGTPVAIKTKNSVILDTYISAIKITQSKLIEYTCGNIRIKFIDKLLKERS